MAGVVVRSSIAAGDEDAAQGMMVFEGGSAMRFGDSPKPRRPRERQESLPNEFALLEEDAVLSDTACGEDEEEEESFPEAPAFADGGADGGGSESSTDTAGEDFNAEQHRPQRHNPKQQVKASREAKRRQSIHDPRFEEEEADIGEAPPPPPSSSGGKGSVQHASASSSEDEDFDDAPMAHDASDLRRIPSGHGITRRPSAMAKSQAKAADEAEAKAAALRKGRLSSGGHSQRLGRKKSIAFLSAKKKTDIVDL
jgi:hypothetical protein